MKALARLTRLAADGLLALAALGLVAMTLIIGWQVFGRYGLGSSPTWSDPAALTLMIWFVTLAAAAGVREGFHIRIVALEEAVPKPVGRAMRVLSHLVVGGCGAALAFWGAQLVVRTWGYDMPGLGIPRGAAYAGLPLAGVLIVLFSLERVIEELAGVATVSPEEATGTEDAAWKP
jgi:TRAP-type C4-dicarboxylate transport system permease small subunit